MTQFIGRTVVLGLAGLLMTGALVFAAVHFSLPVEKRASRTPEPAASSKYVSGQVVDVDGRPVAGAQVGTSFQLAEAPEDTVLHISYADPPVTTDANGRFSMPAGPIAYTKAVVARNGSELGFAIRDGTAPLQLRLAAPARLEVTLVKPFGSRQPVAADLMKDGSPFGYATIDGSAAFAVPQGAFDLVVAQAEIRQAKEPIALDGPAPKAVTIVLQPTAWVKNLGRPAPTITPADLQNASSVAPAELRGKWVLVDFWATWCVPCVREMPRLIDFYTSHAEDRDRFEIVAVHSPDGKSFAGIKRPYDALVANTWGGKSLPFPLAFDPSGETQKRWGIESYPVTLLIDPEGRLVGAATVDDLAKRISR